MSTTNSAKPSFELTDRVMDALCSAVDKTSGTKTSREDLFSKLGLNTPESIEAFVGEVKKIPVEVVPVYGPNDVLLDKSGLASTESVHRFMKAICVAMNETLQTTLNPSNTNMKEELEVIHRETKGFVKSAQEYQTKLSHFANVGNMFVEIVKMNEKLVFDAAAELAKRGWLVESEEVSEDDDESV